MFTRVEAPKLVKVGDLPLDVRENLLEEFGSFTPPDGVRRGYPRTAYSRHLERSLGVIAAALEEPPTGGPPTTEDVQRAVFGLPTTDSVERLAALIDLELQGEGWAPITPPSVPSHHEAALF